MSKTKWSDDDGKKVLWTNNTTGQSNVKTVDGEKSGDHSFFDPTPDKSRATVNERNDPVKVIPKEGFIGGDRSWRPK